MQKSKDSPNRQFRSLSFNELKQLKIEINNQLKTHQAAQGSIPRSLYLAQLQDLTDKSEILDKELTCREIQHFHRMALVMYFRAIPECKNIYADNDFKNLLSKIETLGGTVNHIEYQDGLSAFARPPAPIKQQRPQVFDVFGQELIFRRPIEA
jgi:hypothetical protein